MISVIVPVYNVKDYIKKCVRSILGQTYVDFELLLIDDGSFDGSEILCDELAKEDTRISVIHQKNAGLSAARNTGLDNAKGQYVTFVDSDDYISSTFLDDTLKAIKKSGKQIACCPFVYKYEDREERLVKQDAIFSKEEALNELYSKKGLIAQRVYVMSWGKLYDARLFKELRFPIGRLHEDTATTYKLIDKSNGVAFVSSAEYFYLQRSDGIMGNLSKDVSHVKNYQDTILIYDEQIEYFGETNNKLAVVIKNQKVRRVLSGFATEINKETKEYLLKYIKSIKNCDGVDKKLKLLCVFAKYMPTAYRVLVSKIIFAKRNH